MSNFRFCALLAILALGCSSSKGSDNQSAGGGSNTSTGSGHSGTSGMGQAGSTSASGHTSMGGSAGNASNGGAGGSTTNTGGSATNTGGSTTSTGGSTGEGGVSAGGAGGSDGTADGGNAVGGTGNAGDLVVSPVDSCQAPDSLGCEAVAGKPFHWECDHNPDGTPPMDGCEDAGNMINWCCPDPFCSRHTDFDGAFCAAIDASKPHGYVCAADTPGTDQCTQPVGGIYCCP